MAEDLENILMVAFAPRPVEVRHYELALQCAYCFCEIERFYPFLGLPIEMRYVGEEWLDRPCPGCGHVFEALVEITYQVLAVVPEERGWSYCLSCRQLFKLEKLVAVQPSGYRCRGCQEIETIVAQIKGGDANGDW